jgi:ABC-type bacteriocin/lantibiotic exporter with double-glycine peptidase domain
VRSSAICYLLMVCLCLGPGTGASPAQGNSGSAPPGHVPQCGHWVVLRCCEILGVPLEMEDVMRLLPFRPQGHSMSSLKKTLEAIGLRVEARKARFGTLVTGRFHVIAHLQPDHYVVVFRADERYVTLFDGYGRRVRRAAPEFQKQWSGKILRVSRPSGETPLPAFPGFRPPPGPTAAIRLSASGQG